MATTPTRTMSGRSVVKTLLNVQGSVMGRQLPVNMLTPLAEPRHLPRHLEENRRARTDAAGSHSVDNLVHVH